MPPTEIAWRYIEWIARLGIRWFRKDSDIPDGIGALVDGARRNELRFGNRPIRLLNKVDELRSSHNDPETPPDSRPVIPLCPAKARKDGAFWLLRPNPTTTATDEADSSWISIKIMRFCLYNEEPRSYGFRFDAPEAPSERNSFPHLQFIRGNKNLEWVSERVPAVPILAESPPELVLNALISLYGKEDIRTMVSEGSGQLKGPPENQLRKYLSKLKKCHRT